jgi:hypothetical protein
VALDLDARGLGDELEGPKFRHLAPGLYVDAQGDLVRLEVNPQPGMTPTSLVPELAAHAGLSFPELVSWMVEEASCNR